jgi:hypothetical protein
MFFRVHQQGQIVLMDQQGALEYLFDPGITEDMVKMSMSIYDAYGLQLIPVYEILE